MAPKANVTKLLEAQAEARCAVLHLMTAVSEMHTAMLLPYHQQRTLIAHASAEVLEAQRTLHDVLTIMEKKRYRRRRPRTPRVPSSREVERREARRPNG